MKSRKATLEEKMMSQILLPLLSQQEGLQDEGCRRLGQHDQTLEGVFPEEQSWKKATQANFHVKINSDINTLAGQHHPAPCIHSHSPYGYLQEALKAR